ncbi:hypothetical protein H0H87_005953 [Tephrocybe sp. NHM501043]|nr:hypothetical protein H0H87_005953 [Tephrocybe sp. NHM501043]
MAYAGEPTAHLGWANVALGFSFILFDVAVSGFFGLGIERALLTAAVRCVLQLAVVAVLLQKVFSTENPWAVAGIALLLNLLGTFEIVANKSKRRHRYMFPSIFIGMVGSTIPISIIGSRFAMSTHPFWSPVQYIPIVGMLCGSTISGIVVSVTYVLKELQENRDKVEMYLTFGASRMEACRPVAREALRLALTPVVNQMSVIGIIAIPGMMTGAILGGSSVEQAARLQMIIMFMISSATALASFFTAIAVIAVTVDSEHRVRPDRIENRDLWVWRARAWLGQQIVSSVKGAVEKLKEKTRRSSTESLGEEERELLITSRPTGM